jgi:hypothetical protein
MKNSYDYKKGGNKGAIMEVEYAGVTTFTAVTATTSKDYKSLKGAKAFMAKQGYTPALKLA